MTDKEKIIDLLDNAGIKFSRSGITGNYIRTDSGVFFYFDGNDKLLKINRG